MESYQTFHWQKSIKNKICPVHLNLITYQVVQNEICSNPDKNFTRKLKKELKEFDESKDNDNNHLSSHIEFWEFEQKILR